MKKFSLIRSVITLCIVHCALCITPAKAQVSEVCEKVIGSGASRALLTLETDSLDRIVVTLNAGDGGDEAATVFRAAGLDINGWKFDGQAMTDYFSMSPTNPDNHKQVFFTPLHADSVLAMKGRRVTYNKFSEGTSTAWRTSQDGNSYTLNGATNFSYTYGATCLKLDAPVITDINSSKVITFSSVPNATSYTLRVYLGTIVKHVQTVRSGQVINFTPYQSATYNVTLTASGTGYRSSAESAAYPWTLVAEPVTLGGSEYCGASLGSGNSQAYITWQTLANGDVEIVLSGDDYTVFRGDAMGSLANFTVGAGPASAYFSRSYSSGTNKYTLRLKNASVKPAPGEKINHSGTVEWKTQLNSNAYGTYSFHYTYGTVCGVFAPPVITSISADSAVMFDPIPGATSYVAKVYLNGVFKYSQNIQPGGILHFFPLETGTYSVTLTASGSGYTDSEESAPYAWALTAPEIEVGNSEYCYKSFGSGSSLAYLTWQTLANGDVEILISGDEGTAFRSNGMGSNSLSNFMLGSMPASTYFSLMYDGDGASAYTLHLKDSTARPSVGQKITYNGTVEWKTMGNTNAYGTQRFSYTYGSSCPGLETPAIQSISSAGDISLDNTDDGASYYKIYIYRGELLMATYNVEDGGTIVFEPTATYNYTVYAQAYPSVLGYIPSDLSEPYIWHVAAAEPDIDMSDVCSKFVSNNDGGVYLTAETDDDGQMIFHLSGPKHPVWRNNGLELKAMRIGASAVNDYFSARADFVGDSVLILRPTSGGLGIFFPGDVVTFNGTVEWSIIDAAGTATARYVTGYQFRYVYGSTCTRLLPRLDMPMMISVTDEGEVAYQVVDNASSYEIKVIDEDADEMVRQVMLNGDTILREQAIFSPFSYYVSVRALPGDVSLYRPSLWSDAILWTPSYRDIPEIIEPEDDPEYDPKWDEEPDAIDDIEATIAVKKIYYNGQIYIIRNGVVYTILGYPVF